MSRSPLLLFSLAVAAGCSGKDPILAPPVTTDDDSPPIIETGLEGGAVDASFFSVLARFAYDPATGMHTSFAEPGSGLSPVSFDVLLIDGSALYDGPNEQNSCSVTLEMDTPQPVAAWVETQSAYTGFDVPPSATVRDRCKAYILPSEFEADAGSHIAKWRWGIGIGVLDEAVEAQLRKTLPASQWSALESYILGAVGWSDAFTGSTMATGDGFVTQGYGTAFEVDGNFEIALSGTGNPLPILSESVVLEEGVARAYYEVQLGPFGPGTFLAQDPP